MSLRDAVSLAQRQVRVTADGLFPPNGESERAVHAQSGHRGPTRRGEAENANAIPAEMTAPHLEWGSEQRFSTTLFSRSRRART
jgi:hypothetical protein